MKYAKCVGGDFDFHIAKVDRTLAKDGYELRILGNEANGSFTTQRIQTLARPQSAVIAINGYNFSTTTGTYIPGTNMNIYEPAYIKPTDGALPITSLVMNGVIKNRIPGGNTSEVIMAFDNAKDGKISISRILKENFDFNSNWAFGSRTTVLRGGFCLRLGEDYKDQVSAIGYSTEKIVFLSSTHSDKGKLNIIASLCNAFTDEGITDAVLLDGGGSAQLVVDNDLKNPNSDYLKYDNARHVAYGIGLVKIPATAQCKRDKLNCADKLGRVIKNEGLALTKADSTTLRIPLGTKFTIKEVTTDKNFKVVINTYDSEGKLVELFGVISGNLEFDRWEIFDGDINNANVETRVATVSANARLYKHKDSTLLDCYGTGCRDVPKTFYVHKFFDSVPSPSVEQDGCAGHRWALVSYKGLSRDFVGIEVAKMAYVCSVAFLDSNAMSNLFEQNCGGVNNKSACVGKIGRVINSSGMKFYDKDSNTEKTGSDQIRMPMKEKNYNVE